MNAKTHRHQDDNFGKLSDQNLSEVIEMALSDRVSFSHIQAAFGISSNEVKRLMRTHLRRGSYVTWRKRVREFTARREFYK
jgi:uncharacterized protein (TIGR03643 family)